MGLSRKEYWSGLPCPPPGDLPNPGTEPRSPVLQADSLPEPEGGLRLTQTKPPVPDLVPADPTPHSWARLFSETSPKTLWVPFICSCLPPSHRCAPLAPLGSLQLRCNVHPPARPPCSFLVSCFVSGLRRRVNIHLIDSAPTVELQQRLLEGFETHHIHGQGQSFPVWRAVLLSALESPLPRH